MKPIKKRAQKAQIKKELMPITWYSQSVGVDVSPKTKK